MSKLNISGLTPREAQIMEILYDLGSASASDIHSRMADAPSYSAVRAFLRILEEKGQVAHKQDGARYVYAPRHSWASAAKSAIEQVARTYFDDSIEKVVATLISGSKRPSDDEFARLEEMIREARKAESCPGKGDAI
jgi:predicted transcriptional regulator